MSSPASTGVPPHTAPSTGTGTRRARWQCWVALPSLLWWHRLSFPRGTGPCGPHNLLHPSAINYAASSPPCGAGTQLPGEGQARPNSSSPPTLRTCFPTPPCGAAQAPSMFLLTGRDPRALPWAGCGEQAVLLLLQGQMWASVTHQPGVFLPPVTGNQSSSKMEALPEGPPPPVSSAELQLWEEAEPGGEGSALRAPWGAGQPQHCAHTSRRATERVSCNSATLAASPERCWSGSHLSAD